MSFIMKQRTFEGPLDLLLELIERQELDITTISLAAVTEDYLDQVRELERQNLPEISEFLVVAARLILLKSRALLPSLDDKEAEEDDLAARLREYQLYKSLAKQLSERLESDYASVGRAPTPVAPPATAVTEGVDLRGLHQAFVTVLDRLPAEPARAVETLEEQVTIEECIERVVGELADGPQPFERLFSAVRSRVAMIVSFLAILELVKQRRLAVTASAGTLTIGLRS